MFHQITALPANKKNLSVYLLGKTSKNLHIDREQFYIEIKFIRTASFHRSSRRRLALKNTCIIQTIKRKTGEKLIYIPISSPRTREALMRKALCRVFEMRLISPLSGRLIERTSLEFY